MPKTRPFEEYLERYEEWFERNRYAYFSELEAVRSLLPPGRGIEIGVGTGRFAAPLGIREGVEPSRKVASVAERRGIRVWIGAAEELPLRDSEYDFALLVTTICFLDDPDKAFEEIRRILKPNGYVVVGFVDRESELGRKYMGKREENVFYREATFFSVEEVVELLRTHGFCCFEFRQTVFKDPEEMDSMDPVLPGYGEGSFVVVRAKKVGGHEEGR